MNKDQKIGGIASLIEALCYIIGFGVFVFFLNGPGHLKPVENVQFLIKNETLILSTMAVIYILAAFALLVLVLALHERLKDAARLMMLTATSIGLIWSGIVLAAGMIFIVGSQTAIELYASNPEQAGTIWLTIGIVADAIGGGTELVGGVWILLVSIAASSVGTLSKPLNYLGIILGISGIFSIVPALADLVSIFGLGQIVWFLWTGAIMIVRPAP